jgi:hypothetical protein
VRGLEGEGGPDPAGRINFQVDVDPAKSQRVELEVKSGDAIVQLAGGLDGEGGDRFRG